MFSAGGQVFFKPGETLGKNKFARVRRYICILKFFCATTANATGGSVDTSTFEGEVPEASKTRVDKIESQLGSAFSVWYMDVLFRQNASRMC